MSIDVQEEPLITELNKQLTTEDNADCFSDINVDIMIEWVREADR